MPKISLTDRRDIRQFLSGESINSISKRRKATLPASTAYYLVNRLRAHIYTEKEVLEYLLETLK